MRIGKKKQIHRLNSMICIMVHGGEMRRRPHKHRLLLVSSLLLLVLLVPSSCAQQQQEQQQDSMLREWVKKQAAKDAAAAAGCTCGKKDAALSAAEANRVVLNVEPADDSSTSDPALFVSSIGEAIAKIPDGNTKRYVISIQAGTVFREKVVLGRSKPFVTLASSDPKAQGPCRHRLE